MYGRNEKIFCPLVDREIEEGYCYELCNIATDEILLDGDKVSDWDEAQDVCKQCGIYEE